MVITQHTQLNATEELTDHKPANPKLAGLWVSTQLRGQKPNTLYLLTGLDEHLLAVLEKLDPSNAMVIYEASLGRLKAQLKRGIYQALLADKRVIVLAGELTANDYNQLHALQIPRFSDIKPLRYNPCWTMDPERYQSFLQGFIGQFNVIRKLQLTNYFDSIFWQATSIANLPTHCTSPDLAVLRDAFKDIPVILVGAGPSLDDAEEFLKAAQGRCIIITGNSSYRKLVNIGVRPDFVMAADPRNYTASGFSSLQSHPGFLVAPFIASPGISELFTGRSLCWSGDNNLIINTLRSRLGLKKGTTLEEKGTISISIADFAYIIGSRQLILVGQDMALKSDGQNHTADSIYTDLNIIGNNPGYPQPDVKMLPGNALEEVPVTEVLEIYLRIFEQWVEAHPDAQIVNTSAIGSKIKGVDYCTHQEALTLLPESIGIDLPSTVAQAIENAPEAKITPQAWIEALRPTYEYAQKLFDLATTAAIEIEALPEKFYNHTYQNHRNVVAIFEYGQQINRLIDQRPDDYALLLDGYLKKTILEYQREVATISADNPNAESLLKNKSFFWALSEGIEPIVGVLKEILDNPKAA